MEVLVQLFLIVVTMVIIWRASDGFETASEYLGRNLTDGIRGATINAIASSIPELLTTIFFLFVLGDIEGFSGGIGTTAGSAIFNGMIIPALVILVVLSYGITQNIRVSRKVILRDGIALILCELILIIFLSGNQLHAWHGLALMGMYLLYVAYIMRIVRRNRAERTADPEEEQPIYQPTVARGRALLRLNLSALIIGKKAMNDRRAWRLLLVATAVMGAACLILVYSCERLGYLLDWPVYFIAVIIASMATSVPDTLISVRDGMRGNYDDAISNALGSNIFDICFALGLPLFIYTLFTGSSIQMLEGTASEGVSELRLLLLLLTIIAFLIYLIGQRMTMFKGILLIAIYFVFTAYIIGKANGNELALEVSSFLRGILQ